MVILIFQLPVILLLLLFVIIVVMAHTVALICPSLGLACVGLSLELSYSWFYFVGLQLLRRTRLLMGLVGDCYIYWDDLRELSGTSHQGPLVIPGPSSSPN